MGAEPLVSPRVFAGRADEVVQLLDAVEAAEAGHASVVLLAGEAGIGKSALAAHLCAVVADRVATLAGSCLPLTSLSVPFLPVSLALRHSPDVTGAPAPDLTRTRESSAEVAVEFDAWLSGLCRDRPVILALDDVHWADDSTLDLLTFVLAGPRDRRLLVVLTVRTTELHEGHHLRRWLADAVRMPGFRTLHLGPLDRVATAELVAGVLGGPPRESLVDDVVTHARGNPYFTRLLVEGLPPDAAALPASFPATLRDAVLAPWHRMSRPARELTRAMAAGGTHLDPAVIRHVARAVLGPADPVPLLREGLDASVLELHDDGSYWFHHPLQAELLESGTQPEQRHMWHEMYAALHAQRLTGDVEDPTTVIAVADHLARGHDVVRAYRWALAASDAARTAGGPSEQLRLLRRALTLLPRVPLATESTVDLLDRIRRAADASGKQEEELAAVDGLLAELDREQSPLEVAALLVRRTDLRLSTGREFAGLADVREAARLSAHAPGTGQHALALAELAHAELWHDDAAGPPHAEAAVVAARASGDARALAYALTARSMATTYSGARGGEADAEEAVQAAASVRDFWAYCHASLWAANAIESQSSPVFADYLRRRIDDLVAIGAPATYVGWLSAVAAMSVLLRGDWRQCTELLRFALGSSPGPMGEVTARLTGASLAAYQGRLDEAEAHLRRAEELYADTSGFLAFEFDAVRADVALAVGDPGRALSAALTGLRGDGVPPTRSERLVPLAARALADQAESLRDSGLPDAPALAGLVDLKREFPQVVRDGAVTSDLYGRQLDALQAMYDAEILRARRHPDAGRAWLAVAEACRGSLIAWDEVYALSRAVQALLPDRACRVDATAALRRGHGLATTLGAAPVVAQLEALARAARIPLDGAAAAQGHPDDAAAPATLTGLTPRERQVLDLVVDGRTYADIARQLVISEKTVSVHISNLLRKTGAANRLELSELARRRAALTASPPRRAGR